MVPAVSSPRREAPAAQAEVADLLATCAREGCRARVAGGATKLGWGHPLPDPDLELSTRALDRIVEHNEGDFTAVLEAGVPLARARAAFAASGQMLALDPPLGDGAAATVGGVVASGDSGPLRHRYGGPRDLVLGVTMALPDGTLARAGGRVIKNVAGYDLAKLNTGAFGTLGAIVQVAVRLHPLPQGTCTAVVRSADPEALAPVSAALAHAQLELQSLDARWGGGGGTVLARGGGAAARQQAEAAARVAEERGLAAELVEEDDQLWDDQRRAQSSADGVLVRVSGVQAQLEAVWRASEAAGARSVATRVAAGVSYVCVDDGEGAAAAVEHLRRALAPSPCVVLDAPAAVREAVDPWGVPEGAELQLMRRLKAQFDPAGACNRGLYVGGI